ncbi:hypothetical protein PHYSODRAFT_304306 [Phytophthora sojae]|uniref:Uncharacterized protein n=1 Tax=Phytophthora sojae (strain P6497) TaxID=1094619 RepID=G4ZZP4_PHYSP|nr:hypothetical protein PHYSODRAFT_304306 [Phytophthora sojae]EGZ10390.1 hypothetical protein PHYSODRAFT_304306 [Phytophthora sojae]|eukprot:XP_009533135.1 hypothetical protein PHYSODRAFT_304306 [Phytophthora sojae]
MFLALSCWDATLIHSITIPAGLYWNVLAKTYRSPILAGAGRLRLRRFAACHSETARPDNRNLLASQPLRHRSLPSTHRKHRNEQHVVFRPKRESEGHDMMRHKGVDLRREWFEGEQEAAEPKMAFHFQQFTVGRAVLEVLGADVVRELLEEGVKLGIAGHPALFVRFSRRLLAALEVATNSALFVVERGVRVGCDVVGLDGVVEAVGARNVGGCTSNVAVGKAHASPLRRMCLGRSSRGSDRVDSGRAVTSFDGRRPVLSSRTAAGRLRCLFCTDQSESRNERIARRGTVAHWHRASLRWGRHFYRHDSFRAQVPASLSCAGKCWWLNKLEQNPTNVHRDY